MLSYDEILTVAGVRIPFAPSIITPLTEAPLRAGQYESGECQALRQVLRPGDRVLELGGGIGFLSAYAALTPGMECVVTVEANPRLIPMIHETHRLNGLSNIRVIEGAVTADRGAEVDFYLRRHFWGSSLDPNLRAYARAVKRPRIAIAPLLEEVKPSVLICDIEGGEDGLFDDADLSPVRDMVIELHPAAYGKDGAARILAALAAHGLEPVKSSESRSGGVLVLSRA
jgi:FkbM family methyltransferase